MCTHMGGGSWHMRIWNAAAAALAATALGHVWLAATVRAAWKLTTTLSLMLCMLRQACWTDAMCVQSAVRWLTGWPIARSADYVPGWLDINVGIRWKTMTTSRCAQPCPDSCFSSSAPLLGAMLSSNTVSVKSPCPLYSTACVTMMAVICNRRQRSTSQHVSTSSGPQPHKLRSACSRQVNLSTIPDTLPGLLATTMPHMQYTTTFLVTRLLLHG